MPSPDPSPATNSHAAELQRLERKMLRLVALGFAAWVGFRLTIYAYSGPSVALGLGASAAIAIVVWLALLYLLALRRER
ncbi:MAG TPA: hypothetical protein VER11_33515 [Polyangiaceae bacterium]|nr:hypothetical protein [Polyangiaceae bacterium]